jgi:parallel beta-helix repeat protein
MAVSTSQSLRSLVASSKPGTAFVLSPGVHRLESVVPKDGDSFYGQTGAVLSGARALSFAKDGTRWVATGQTQQGQAAGECRSDSPACQLPEDLFVNDVMLTRVMSLDEVAPGKWFFDYDADRIYIADDPTGKNVETSVTPKAFDGNARNVTIQGLVIEKYATPAQVGTINGEATVGWIVEGNEIRFNHGTAVLLADGGRIASNYIHHNGQQGVGGHGTGLLIEHNEIAYNNTAGFDEFWSAGGGKFAFAVGLILRANFVHDNAGYGLWTDIDCKDVTFDGNWVQGNTKGGIHHEISQSATIENNRVIGNGAQGIYVNSSPNVVIANNWVESNGDGIWILQESRGTGTYGPRQTSNLDVRGNVIKSSGRTGLVQHVGDSSYFTTRNNRFEGNTYIGSVSLQWADQIVSADSWRSYGLDTDGSFEG